jgi:hypothetical protein
MSSYWALMSSYWALMRVDDEDRRRELMSSDELLLGSDES